MVSTLIHTAPEAATWLALDPKAQAIALVGPMPPAKSCSFDGALPHVAIDGGIAYAPAPILWAGDGDSGKMPSHIPAFLKPSQDETDLRFCLNGLRAWQWTHLHLYGFLGGRRDHELANFGEIHAEMLQRSRFISAAFHADDTHAAVLFFNAGAHELKIVGTFSLLALAPAVITLSGACAYPAQNLRLPALSGHGISNTGTGTVKIFADSPIFIIL